MFKIYTITILVVSAVISAFLPSKSMFAAVQDDISAKSQQIDEIQRQIDQYQQQIEATHSQALTLQNEIKTVDAQISQIALEIKSLAISISKTNLEIGDTQSKISDAEDKIRKYDEALGQYLRIIYKNDQETLTGILFKNGTISDFFNDLNNIKTTQDNIQITVGNIRDLKEKLEGRKVDLEDKQDELEHQQNLEQVEKKSLDQAKSQKNTILKQTKGQESKFQELVKKSQKDIEAIRSQIIYLEQNGVTAEEAVKYGQLAAIATGIRPAFLIAELEVESGLGRNVGKCNRAGDPPEKSWRSVMNSRDFNPFLAITSKLGLNPDTTPVSCRQYINGRPYGWGGAMGPAQFIPSTWMGYADEVARLVGRAFANPWNIEDAFTAASVKLAKAGAAAKTVAAERAASKAYYSGKSNCSTTACNSYANAVQRMAAKIELSL